MSHPFRLLAVLAAFLCGPLSAQQPGLPRVEPPPLPEKDPPALPRRDPPPLPEPGPEPRPEPVPQPRPGPVDDHRPNIVLIIADDLAWDDLGPFGNKNVRTPNLDRLAAEGMCFDQAFLTISSCSPSRASILTGRYPHQTDAEELHWPLPGDQPVFTQRLRQAGYWVGAAGKWHLGDEVRQHFDLIKEVDTSGFQLPANAAAQGEAAFVESTQGDAKSGCADWVPLLQQRAHDQPFFIWLAAVDPHRPYDDAILAEPHSPAEVVLPPYHPDTPLVRADYARYYDEITRLDRFVGAVLAELEAQAVTENTLVLFLSDNGRPFPRDKTTLYDSGIRTPMIARWPKVVQPGTRCAQLVSVVDLATTFLALAEGIADKRMVGKDFSPLLRGEDVTIRDAIFAEKNWHDYEDRSRAVRDRRFKYILNHYHDLPGTPPADAARSDTFKEMQRLRAEGSLSETQSSCFVAPRPREELYDLEADPYELKNLAADPDHQDTLARFRAEHDAWRNRTGDTLPERRTPDEFDRDTGSPTPARIRPRWSKAKMIKEGVLAAPE